MSFEKYAIDPVAVGIRKHADLTEKEKEAIISARQAQVVKFLNQICFADKIRTYKLSNDWEKGVSIVGNKSKAEMYVTLIERFEWLIKSGKGLHMALYFMMDEGLDQRLDDIEFDGDNNG